MGAGLPAQGQHVPHGTLLRYAPRHRYGRKRAGDPLRYGLESFVAQRHDRGLWEGEPRVVYGQVHSAGGLRMTAFAATDQGTADVTRLRDLLDAHRGRGQEITLAQIGVELGWTRREVELVLQD